MKKNNVWILVLFVGFMAFAGWTVLSAKSQTKPAARPQETAAAPEVKQAPAVSGIAKQVPIQMRGYVLSALPAEMARVVEAGDSVDVLCTFDATMKNGERDKVTVTLLQNVKVLRTGTQIYTPLTPGTNPREESYLVLALSPRDAQFLSLAKMQGVIDVIVRSEGDTASYLMELATFEKLFK